jgi:hypothetical protein
MELLCQACKGQKQICIGNGVKYIDCKHCEGKGRKVSDDLVLPVNLDSKNSVENSFVIDTIAYDMPELSNDNSGRVTFGMDIKPSEKQETLKPPPKKKKGKSKGKK